MKPIVHLFSRLTRTHEPWSWTFISIVASSFGLFLGLCLRDAVEPVLPIQGFSSRNFIIFEFLTVLLQVLVLWKFGAFVLTPIRGGVVFELLYNMDCDFRATVDTYVACGERRHAIGELKQISQKLRTDLLVWTVFLAAITYACLVCLISSAWFLGTSYAGFTNCPVLDGGSCGPEMGMLGHVYFSLVTLTTLGYGDIHPANCYGFVLGTLTIIVGICVYGAAFMGFVNVWPETLRKIDREIHRQIDDFGENRISLGQLLGE